MKSEFDNEKEMHEYISNHRYLYHNGDIVKVHNARVFDNEKPRDIDFQVLGLNAYNEIIFVSLGDSELEYYIGKRVVI